MFFFSKLTENSMPNSLSMNECLIFTLIQVEERTLQPFCMASFLVLSFVTCGMCMYNKTLTNEFEKVIGSLPSFAVSSDKSENKPR